MSAQPGRRRALLAGWFSFEEVVATIGDDLGCEVTDRWLREAGWQVDVACAPYLGRGLDWRTLDPGDYDLLVFTTGPLSGDPLLRGLLDRFAALPAWAVNVSVVDAATAARFARIWARDDAAASRPDLALAATVEVPPLLAVAYTGAQAEYPHGRQADTAALVHGWLESRGHAAVELDTDNFAHHRWPRHPGQQVAVIARCDAVVTMRLHGLVLALAQGVPAVAVDGVPGGAKVCRQAAALDWPLVTDTDGLDERRLDELLARALAPEARTLAVERRDAARGQLQALRGEVVRAAVTAAQVT